MLSAIGLQALAVHVPDQIVTNDHWRRNHPELVADAEQRNHAWSRPTQGFTGSEIFDRAMAPYLDDPFRGIRERRRLAAGDTALDLEAAAARSALEAAGLGIEDIDLLICSSFQPDAHGIGGATFLARELGLRGAAWNLESACSSTLVAFQTACGQIAAGLHRRALVVTSCTYSRVTEDDDPLSWALGDAATAMVVGPVAEGRGLLGSHVIHSGETCGAVRYDLENDVVQGPRLRLRTGKQASRLLRETSEAYLRECTSQALDRAGIRVSDLDYCIFSTPLAWYSSFCAQVIGIDRRKTLSVYPLYGNVGPSLLGLNLFHAGHHRLRTDQLVLLYSVGSVSSCGAVVMRWGDVSLGALPMGFVPSELEALEAHALNLCPNNAAA